MQPKLMKAISSVIPNRLYAAAHAFVWPGGRPKQDRDALYKRPSLTERGGLRRCIFDVGANDGSFGIDMAIRHPWLQVFAFEPTPYLYKMIKAKTEGLGNYEILRAAVSDVPGEATFNIAGQADWGCSSLMTFSENLNETWPGRTDFKVTETATVPVIRLDDFLRERDFEGIAYLHIDAQGCDLQVLRSVGEFTSYIEMGCLEAATSRNVAIYKGAHTLEDIIPYLTINSFVVDRILPNDSFNNEVNIFFSRK